jgi:DNA-directed RNA polymerase subunit RPC12/RpoP
MTRICLRDGERPEEAGGSCPYCGQSLPDGVSVEREPMLEADSPGRYFFCAYCGQVLLGRETDTARLEEPE